MPGIVQEDDQSTTAVVGIDRAQNRALLSKRGAAMLLILIGLSLASVTLYLQEANSRQMIRKSLDNYTQAHAEAASLKKEQHTMEPIKSDSAKSSVTDSMNVQVNGQMIELPQSGNGIVHKEVVSSDGTKTTVDIDVNSSSTSVESSQSTALNLNIQSSQVVESEAE